MRDLGRMGESAFSMWCNSVGIVANASQIDTRGWDFFIEFPSSQNNAVPVDMQPAPLECKVQVKATDKGKKKIPIAVSNLNKLIKAQMPAFICVIEFEGKNEAQKAYLVHIGKEVIEQTLKRIRELDVQGESCKLNKKEIIIHYGEKDRLSDPNGDSFKNAIERHIPDGAEKYISKKNELLRSLGFEKGAGHFTFTMTGADPIKDMVDLTLGLRKEINFDNLVGYHSRFGILSKKPFVNSDKGILSLKEVKPFTRGVLTFREYEFSPGMSFPVELYNSPLNKVVPDKYFKFRAKGKFFEMVFEPFCNKVNYTFNLTNEIASNLKELRDILKVLTLIKTCSNELIMDTECEKLPLLRAKIINNDAIEDWSEAYRIAEMAMSLCQRLHIQEESIIVSNDDLFHYAASIQQAFGILNEPLNRMTIEFTSEDDDLQLNKRTACTFPVRAVIGDRIIGCFLGMAGSLTLLEEKRYILTPNEIIMGSSFTVNKDEKIDESIITREADNLETKLQKDGLQIVKIVS